MIFFTISLYRRLVTAYSRVDYNESNINRITKKNITTGKKNYCFFISHNNFASEKARCIESLQLDLIENRWPIVEKEAKPRKEEIEGFILARIFRIFVDFPRISVDF
jgi:hypothetical protein